MSMVTHLGPHNGLNVPSLNRRGDIAQPNVVFGFDFFGSELSLMLGKRKPPKAA
jgi:hypothetical protein